MSTLNPLVDWKVETLTKFKEQFYKRIAEAPSMTQDKASPEYISEET